MKKYQNIKSVLIISFQHVGSFSQSSFVFAKGSMTLCLDGHSVIGFPSPWWTNAKIRPLDVT